MEEEKRLDIDEIKDLELRVDTLEEQPLSPLICPIYKKDLDDLNDRITILEGGTPSTVKNPMNLNELNGFEGRVEELEENPPAPTRDTVQYSAGTSYILDRTFFSETLLNNLPEQAASFNIPTTPDSGRPVIPTIIFLGPDTEYTAVDSGKWYSPVFIGHNLLGISFDYENKGVQLWGMEIHSDEPTTIYADPSFADITEIDSATTAISTWLLALENATVNGARLTETYELFNPVKVVIINANNVGEIAFNDYVEFDLDVEGQPFKEGLSE